MQKSWKNTETLAYGISSESTISDSYLMNTNMTEFRWFSKIFPSLCFGQRHIASVLEGLSLFCHYKMMQKTFKNDWKPGKWVLSWEYSVRAIRWIPTWHGLDVFQKSLHSYVLDESSLGIGRVNCVCYCINVIGQILVQSLSIMRCTSSWCEYNLPRDHLEGLEGLHLLARGLEFNQEVHVLMHWAHFHFT